MSLANKAQSTSQLTTLDNVSIRTKSPTQQQEQENMYHDIMKNLFWNVLSACSCRVNVCMWVHLSLSLSLSLLFLWLAPLKATRFRVCISCRPFVYFGFSKTNGHLSFLCVKEMRANRYLFCYFSNT